MATHDAKIQVLVFIVCELILVCLFKCYVLVEVNFSFCSINKEVSHFSFLSEYSRVPLFFMYYELTNPQGVGYGYRIGVVN